MTALLPTARLSGLADSTLSAPERSIYPALNFSKRDLARFYTPFAWNAAFYRTKPAGIDGHGLRFAESRSRD